MLKYIKNFKVSYSYPLEYPVKVVINHLGLLGLVGWISQKYGCNAVSKDFVISERIIEVPTFHEWFGRIFPNPTSVSVLEIGHVASQVSLELASLGADVTAIDLRQYPFKHPKLLSITGDFLTFDFQKTYDCIFSLSTIEHFGISERYGGSEDQEGNNLDDNAFEKIANLLNANGYAIITVPFAKSWISGIWFKVYTRDTIEKKLSRYFMIEEKRYYKRIDNVWQPVSSLDDPISPHDGVALFLLKKQ